MSPNRHLGYTLWQKVVKYGKDGVLLAFGDGADQAGTSTAELPISEGEKTPSC